MSPTFQCVPMQTSETFPYEELVRDFLNFQLGFPLTTPAAVLDAITQILIGTKEIRYGRIPTPETLATVRKVIRDSMAQNIPIPVLIPWGGKKPVDTSSVDVAELSALKILKEIAQAVRAVYEPGLYMKVRIEDIGAVWTYTPEKDSITHEVEQYSSDMDNLLHIISPDFITFRESSVVSMPAYKKVARSIEPFLSLYVKDSDKNGIVLEPSSPAWKKLREMGWNGIIPFEQRKYYRERYQSLYPGVSNEQATDMMTAYFAGSWARYQVKARGYDRDTPHIQMTFVPPIPGAPEALFGNMLYYRTVPYSHARTHISPWRGKGYLKIQNDHPVFKVASWHEVLDLQVNSVKLTDDKNNSVILRADYQLV